MWAHDFSLQYVADNVARATPGLYTFTAAWAALEGSILLWALALSIYVAATAFHFRRRAHDPFVAWATLTQYAVLLFFFALMLFAANPFKPVSGVIPLDGRGPNPLLQNHPLVAIHPPMLYAGYVGFTIPFSFAIAALVTGRFGEGWLADMRRTTLIAWGFLTVGIVLGAWWSYSVLGWGGYWGWDPVENASLLPWLTATAFIHSVMVQERSGHVAGLEPVARHRDVLPHDPRHVPHPLGRHQLGARVLGVEHRAVVAHVPRDLHVHGHRADRVARRQAAIAGTDRLADLARGRVPAEQPACSRASRSSCSPARCSRCSSKRCRTARSRLGSRTSNGSACRSVSRCCSSWPSGPRCRGAPRAASCCGNGCSFRRGSVAITLVVAVLAGARGIANVLAFALGAFTLASIGRSVVVGVRARRRAHTDEGIAAASVRTVRGNPRLYGGLTVHVGVIVVAVALATTAGWTTRRELDLAPGQSASVRGHKVTYVARDVVRTNQKTTIKARVHIDGIGTLAPAISTYPSFADGIGTPSIHTDPLHDWYITLVSSPTGGRATIGVQVGTMVMWLWIGGLIMVLGIALALVPARRRRPLDRESVVVSVPDPDGNDPAETPTSLAEVTT